MTIVTNDSGSTSAPAKEAAATAPGRLEALLDAYVAAHDDDVDAALDAKVAAEAGDLVMARTAERRAAKTLDRAHAAEDALRRAVREADAEVARLRAEVADFFEYEVCNDAGKESLGWACMRCPMPPVPTRDAVVHVPLCPLATRRTP